MYMNFSAESGVESGVPPHFAVNPEVKPLLDLPVGPVEEPVGDIIVTVRKSDMVDESGTGQDLDMMFSVTGRVLFSTWSLNCMVTKPSSFLILFPITYWLDP